MQRLKKLTKRLLNLVKKTVKLKTKAIIVILFIASVAMFGGDFQHYTLRYYLKDKVVKVVNPENYRNGGTGFYVKAPSGKTYIITNRHVCKLAKNNTLVVVRGNNDPSFVHRKIVKISKRHDLCAVEARQYNSSLKVSDSLYEGEKVHTLGHPTLQPITLSSGQFVGFMYIFLPVATILERKCKADEQQYFIFCLTKMSANEITAYVRGGSSGSPVVDSFGNLVGVVFAGNTKDPFQSFMVPLKEIHLFLKGL